MVVAVQEYLFGQKNENKTKIPAQKEKKKKKDTTQQGKCQTMNTTVSMY